ncbi:MAG TPA: aldo/keto reductase [Anaerovoracaceae bacterium]|nr:aldo/keto reductase [Anaerovoracaceae bacterium]
MTDVPYVKLSNGVDIPMVGFGSWQGLGSSQRLTVEENYSLSKSAVEEALKAGYRSIDTANGYHNEMAVGDAVVESGIPRERIFITTKFATDVEDPEQAYELTRTAIENSLKNLKSDYIDLYLVHSPVAQRLAMWKALEEAYKAGKLRALGVSKFVPRHLDQLIESCEIRPVANQIEHHPYMIKTEVIENSRRHGLLIEAFSPLMQGQVLLSDPLIRDIAEAHGKTVPQIILRWDLQKGVRAIPKSNNPARVRENFNIFDFELSNDEMESIDALGIKGLSFNPRLASLDNNP